MFLQVLLLIGVTSVTHASVIPKFDSDELFRSNADFCQTPGCIKTATEILENMDERVDPCDNFYQFACGGYVKKRTIPDDKSSIGVFTDVQDERNNQLKELMERKLDGTEPKFIKMTKDLYDSCMNTDKVEEAGSEPLKQILNTYGGWPVVEGDGWDASKFDWMNAVFNSRRHGYDPHTLVVSMVDIDFQNNTAYIFTFDQTMLGMPDRTYLVNGLSDNATAAYYNLMIKAATKLGANQQTAEKELLEALKFEMTLANYSKPNEERRNFGEMYNKMSVTKLKELAPEVDWLKYINGLLNEPIISDLENVIVTEPEFMKKFAKLIASTDKRVIANYMLWRVVLGSISGLSKDWRDLEQEYSSTITGTSKELSRVEQCLNTVGDKLVYAVASYYVKNYFPAESKRKVLEIVLHLSREFYSMLKSVDWMANSTKEKAKEKARAMTPYIGYPEEILNDTLLLEYYKNLTITTDNYFENIRNLNKMDYDESYGRLRKPNVKGDWKMHAQSAVVNAFNNLLENSIEFPAAILQKAFFNKDRPYYMNFGSLGYVIGHEITHGFDDMGRQFDKEGNNVNWWDPETDKKFTEKAQCIIDQYSNYTTENGLNLNGINTQGENIADNGGMKEAFLAYKSWAKENGPEKMLPGLKYTPNQLFWISAANVWCTKTRVEALRLEVLTEPHSPGPFRVIGPMSNFIEFSEAFQCPLGSFMNPTHKCKVW